MRVVFEKSMELCHACFEWHVRKVRDHKPVYEPMSRSVARTHIEFSLWQIPSGWDSSALMNSRAIFKGLLRILSGSWKVLISSKSCLTPPQLLDDLEYLK